MSRKHSIPYMVLYYIVSPVSLLLVALKYFTETVFLFGYAGGIRTRWIVFKQLIINEVNSHLLNISPKTNGISEISLKKGNTALKAYMRNNSVDANTLRDIFIKKIYDFECAAEPRVIFDLGANVGYASLFFALKYPGAEIYAFEPLSENFRMLEMNTGGRYVHQSETQYAAP